MTVGVESSAAANLFSSYLARIIMLLLALSFHVPN